MALVRRLCKTSYATHCSIPFRHALAPRNRQRGYRQWHRFVSQRIPACTLVRRCGRVEVLAIVLCASTIAASPTAFL